MNRSNPLPKINSSLLLAKQLSTTIGIDFIYTWNEKIASYALTNLDEIIEESLISVIIANAAEGLDYESCLIDLNRSGLTEKLTPQDWGILKSRASENDIAKATWKLEHARALFWSVGLLTELIASRDDNDYSAVVQLATLPINNLKKAANFQPIEQLIEQYIFYSNYLAIYNISLLPGTAIGVENIMGPLGYQIVVNRTNAFQRLLTFSRTLTL